MSFFSDTDEDNQQQRSGFPNETHPTLESAEGASHMEKLDLRPTWEPMPFYEFPCGSPDSYGCL